MTEQRPNLYRPTRVPWPVPEEIDNKEEENKEPREARGEMNHVPLEYRYIEDWDLVGRGEGTIIS
jgi:hypothetical protein